MSADDGHRLLRFFREARRRKVYTTAVAYVAISIALLELGQALFDTLQIPVGYNILTVLLLLGFPLVVVLAWIFDVGAHGIQRTPPAPQTRTVTPPAAVVQRTAAPPADRRPVASAVEPVDAPAEAPAPERVRRAALAHVRHELKTPIGAIIGYAEMLLEDLAPGAPEAADLRSVRQAGHELLALVEKILDTEAGATAGELTSYSERIRAELRDPITAVIGYAELLLEVQQESPHARLAPDLDRIRAAAMRLLELSTDIVQVGTGGHTVAQLGVASVLTETVLSKLRPIDAAATDERQGVLLVVDDNPLNRDLLSRQLARRGYEVATAESGYAALQLLEEQAFDLVLLDILMPGIDGVEVLRRIRQQARLAELPVIMTSSLDEIDSVIRCLEIGAADYVTKPFDPVLLDARIGTCLQLRAARARESWYRAQLEARDAAAGAAAALPAIVAARVHGGNTGLVDSGDAAVLVCDLERVLHGEARTDPAAAADRLRRGIELLRGAAERNGIELVAQQGAVVLLVAGIPSACEDTAGRVAAASLDVLSQLGSEAGLAALRLGLHIGAAHGALLDGPRRVYHVWGDAVDLARRLEQRAEPGTIHVSPAAATALKDRFVLSPRGVQEVAGRQMRTHTLDARALQPSA